MNPSDPILSPLDLHHGLITGAVHTPEVNDPVVLERIKSFVHPEKWHTSTGFITAPASEGGYAANRSLRPYQQAAIEPFVTYSGFDLAVSEGFAKTKTWGEYCNFVLEDSTELQIRLQPAPVLSMVAEPIADDEFGPDVQVFGEKMITVMRKFEGVGLAANQVGLLKRMFILTLDVRKEDDPTLNPWGTERTPVIICNPVIELEGQDVVGQEGCLSMPFVFEQVWRKSDVFLKYQTPLGEEKSMYLSNFEARICQHEFDHLQGVEFCDPSRMPRQLRRKVEAQWRKLRPIALRDGKGI